MHSPLRFVISSHVFFVSSGLVRHPRKNSSSTTQSNSSHPRNRIHHPRKSSSSTTQSNSSHPRNRIRHPRNSSSCTTQISQSNSSHPRNRIRLPRNSSSCTTQSKSRSGILRELFPFFSGAPAHPILQFSIPGHCYRVTLQSLHLKASPI